MASLPAPIQNLILAFERLPGVGPKTASRLAFYLLRAPEDISKQLAEETVTATVGGGAIKVTMTGDQRCKGIVIDPDMLKDADAEMLQDMLLSAVNLALDQSRKLAEERMGPLAGGLSGLGF